MTESGLKKADKLLKRVEFVSLSKKGRSKSDRYFIVAYRFNNLDRTRLGITVTRKVGNAVVRNRIKRMVREYFRLNRQRISGHLDINIIAKNAASSLPSKKVYDSLHRILDRINEGL